MAIEQRDVAPFREIALGGVGELTVSLGDEDSVTIQADTEILPYIITEVQGERLMIGFKELGRRPFLSDTGKVHYHVTARALEGIQVSGAGSVAAVALSTEEFGLDVSGAAKATLELTAKRVRTRVSGSGKLLLKGKTERHEIDVSGAGTIRADELAARESRVSISGAGSVRVHAEQELDVRIAGVGQVLYAGTPAVRKYISGLGRVAPIDENR